MYTVYKVPIKGSVPGKLTGCNNEFSYLIWPSLEGSFSYNEVQFKRLKVSGAQSMAQLF